jgi:CheY-like chemotaxis protein
MTRVLVVDDDREIAQLLEHVLADEGYLVEAAPNGAVAFDGMRHHPPDVVLLDLRMPVMDGLSFLHACRQDPRWSDLRIILLSAMPEGTPTADRFDGFVPKPFDLAEVVRTVQLAVSQSTTN